MAATVAPDAPLIAETGGLNAMFVDSTALPQQAIKDILDSAFRSAGQRCSALRVVYLQNDIAPAFLDMLYGAMDELVVGDPWDPSTDIGPIINEGAQTEIVNYIEGASSEGRLLKRLSVPPAGTFVAPSVIKVGGIHDMHREIFGPVLHVATYKAHEIGRVVSDINGSGYGLTFGLHTRIDDRVEALTTCLNVGNIYVNRNQIGAIVGSQPFGGEGLSGTGPKAGGPNYVRRFAGLAPPPAIAPVQQEPLALAKVQAALDAMPPVPRESVGSPVLARPDRRIQPALALSAWRRALPWASACRRRHPGGGRAQQRLSAPYDSSGCKQRKHFVRLFEPR